MKSGSHQKELDLKISEDQFLADNVLLDTETGRHFCEADIPDLTAAVYRCLLCCIISYLRDRLHQCHSELSCLAHCLLVKGKTAKFSKHTRGKKQDLIIETVIIDSSLCSSLARSFRNTPAHDSKHSLTSSLTNIHTHSHTYKPFPFIPIHVAPDPFLMQCQQPQEVNNPWRKRQQK